MKNPDFIMGEIGLNRAISDVLVSLRIPHNLNNPVIMVHYSRAWP